MKSKKKTKSQIDVHKKMGKKMKEYKKTKV